MSKPTIRKLPDGTQIVTFTESFCYACIMEAEAGTTGYQGGDAGHGGRTYIRIQDKAGTCIDVRRVRDDCGDEGVEIILGGDHELDCIIQALKFIRKTLKKYKGDKEDIWSE